MFRVFRGEKIRIRIRADSRDSRAISSPTRHDSALVAETDQNQPRRAEIDQPIGGTSGFDPLIGQVLGGKVQAQRGRGAVLEGEIGHGDGR